MLEKFLFHKHLEDDEQVTIIVHRYWSIGMRKLFWPVTAFLAGWAFFAVAPTPMVLLIIGLWSLFAIGWFVREFLDYYLDAWIVTDTGIIALEWMGWFHRQSTRVLYSDLQGVSYEIKGLLNTLNRCGTLSVEKMSTGTTLSLPDVRMPKKIETIILRNMENYLHSKNLKNARHVQELLSEFVAEKIQLDDATPPPEKPKKRSPMTTRRV